MQILFKKNILYYMMAVWKNNSFNSYTSLEWMCIKLSFILFWFGTFYFSILKSNQIPLPIGFCKLFDFQFILSYWNKKFFILSSLVFCAFYIYEYKMSLTCLILFIISTITFSIEESNGIYNRNTLLTIILFVQFISYFKTDSFTKKNDALQYSIQVIVGSYTLSAISKLLNSGIFWVIDGKRITLQILKSHYQEFSDYGNKTCLIKGNIMVHFIENHQLLLYIVLFISLMLELFSMIALRNKQFSFFYGILLFLMHLGIFYIMDISILPIIVPMVIFMINPLFVLGRLFISMINCYNNNFNLILQKVNSNL